MVGGSHPDKQSLALDGRGKTSIAKAGSIDDSEHTGILFWLVQRSSSPSDVNMVFESASWEQRITLHMPLKKKKTSVVEWQSPELPTIPLLVNNKAVKEHTRLVVFQQVAKKEEEKQKL